MYALHLRGGNSITSARLQQALADLPFDAGTEMHSRRMWHLGSIEQIEARGIQYSGHDLDVLSAALNFLDGAADDGYAHELRATITQGDRT